jgi:hypothetical protein
MASYTGFPAASSTLPVTAAKTDCDKRIEQTTNSKQTRRTIFPPAFFKKDSKE